jgi:sugar phosphate isomerase/epimerase
MRISIVTDEISADPETAIELGVSWGVRDFELRGFGADRVPHFSAFQKQRLSELLDEYDVRVVAISPGVFKCPFPDQSRMRFALHNIDQELYQRWSDARSLVQYHLEELLPASLEYAQQLGAEKVIIFSFQRPSATVESVPDEVLEILWQAAEQSSASGRQLAVEVEDQFWADTGRRTAALLQAVNHPALCANWDPGNAYFAGEEPFPSGYQALRRYVRHVHFKDVVRAQDGSYRYAVEGEIDWSGQIRALADDGYTGFVSIETHMQPKVSSAQAALQRLQALIHACMPSRESVEGAPT